MATEVKILTLKQATGKQLQEAARVAKLQDTPNQIHGLVNAMYSSDPSPMQISVLRIGLRSVGINYVRVAEVVTPASAADKFPWQMHRALHTLAKAGRFQVGGTPGVLGQALYYKVACGSKEDSVSSARTIIQDRGFKKMPYTDNPTWAKEVHLHRKKYIAAVEVADDHVFLIVTKGN